jgi:hypothetical protein
VDVSEQQLVSEGMLGSYRRSLGWSPGGDPAALHETANVLRGLAGPGTIG